MNRAARVVAWVLLVGVVGAGAVWADEQAVPLDKLPKAVAEAVKKRFPKGELVEATKDIEDGATEYCVTVKTAAGKTVDVTLTPEGTITQLVKEIAVKDLPKPVAAALLKKYPKAAYDSVEVVIEVKDGKETVDYYWVELTTANKKMFELAVTPDGTIDSEEEIKEEKKS